MVASVSPPSRCSEDRVFYRRDDYHVGESTGYLLHQVMLSIRRDLERRLALHGLTFAQWVPLWRLKTGQGRTSQEIACEVDIDAGAMTRLLDRLVAKGLIERSRSASDRRVVNLALTPAGEAVAEQIPEVLADVNNAYLKGFRVDEWQQLNGMLRRMLVNGQALASWPEDNRPIEEVS